MDNLVTLGGDRLGTGNKDKIALRNYERSTHDLSYTWKSSVSPGTLVPFMKQLVLPGDTFDIDLNCLVMTHPTVGPMFDSFKVQLDVFYVPIRLYQGDLHMNLLDIGYNMQNVYLPHVVLKAKTANIADNSQVNASCIFKYLGISGLGYDNSGNINCARAFNAVPWLAYYDIFKQYYANKQETNAYIIHNNMNDSGNYIINQHTAGNTYGFPYDGTTHIQIYPTTIDPDIVTTFGTQEIVDFEKIYVYLDLGSGVQKYSLYDIFNNVNGTLGNTTLFVQGFGWKQLIISLVNSGVKILYYGYEYTPVGNINGTPELAAFELSDIDKMRIDILRATGNGYAFVIDANNTLPAYNLPLKEGSHGYSIQSNQEGLLVKTYQSDIFNNWLKTETINNIDTVTQVSTAAGSFDINSLILANKVYNMLNQIAVSDGTYDSWLRVQYTNERSRAVENPVYLGSLIKELGFSEVISTTQTQQQALGTLAGRGTMTKKHKGGTIRVKAEEHGYVIGIISLTPRVVYSQGNEFDMELNNMNDFHMPALDQIGFQDLITERMLWNSTYWDPSVNEWHKSKVGYQPAWLNYMTNYDRAYGSFAEENNEMFMTLNRRYERDVMTTNIKDATTYIDPAKFNYMFAYTKLDAMNFWVQIKADIIARRKMSAKIIPNL